jgi:simple sugar transport system ATP-binding protein
VTASAPVAQAIGVSKRFGATTALHDVSLAVQRGESHAVVGRNGAGKSTLVGVLTGLVKPDRGQVRFGGHVAPDVAQRERWREHVACVYQRSTVIPSLSVGENLVLNAHPSGRGRVVRWRALRAEARRLLAEWEVDADPDTPASELTVGQRQLVEIARALRLGTRFIVLDEPTARLEAREIERLFEHMRRLQGSGVSFLYISHHLDEVYEQCVRVTVLRDGRNVLTEPVAQVGREALVRAMVGQVDEGRDRREPHATPRHADEASPVVLQVRNLTVDGACRSVTLSVRAGECVGLAGLAGCGKSQVADAIVGMLEPDDGEVVIGGRAVRPGRVDLAIEGGVGYVPEDRHARGLVQGLSVEENLTMTVLGRLGPAGIVSPRRSRRVAGELFQALGVRASALRQPVGELSGGNQQRVVLGRALASSPRALVLVSPTAGVDVASKEALYALIGGVGDMGVLLVSDELDELAICDRVLVMFDGALVREYAGDWVDDELVAAMEGMAA